MITIFFLFISTIVNAEVKTITLDQAIQLALKDNPKITAAKAEEESADFRFRQTKSLFLPKLGIDTRYESIESSFQKQRGATSNLFLDWNLFNGFKDGLERHSREFELNKSASERTKQHLFIKTETEAKFFKLLGLNEIIAAYEEAMIRNDAQKENAKKRRGAGLASDSDILEFDLYMGELKSDLEKFRNDLKGAQAEFRELLGESNSTQDFLPKGELTHFHIDESLESLKSRLKSENLNLTSARFAVEQYSAQKKIALAGFLPQLNLTATYGSRGINETQVSPETLITGTARWEIFSGFSTLNKVHEASAQVLKSEANLKQLELSATTQLETAYAKLNSIQAHVDNEAENKLKAQKFFDLVAGEYRRGVKNSADIRSASQFVLQIIVRDILYRSDFFEQKSILEKAVGGEVKIVKGSNVGHTK